MVRGLLVEGWRGISHSYALVNQAQLLHLAGDQRFRLYHRDIELFQPHWRVVTAGFGEEERARIAALEPPPAGFAADVIYRVSYPLRIFPVPGARVFVFGTTEWGALQRGDVLGSLAADGSLNGDGVHLVTPSSWSKVGLTNSGFRDDHVHVVPLGFDARTFRPGSAEERARLRSALGLPPDAFIFLSVGAMTWNKGIGPLLAAFAIHRRRNPQSRLVLKGADAMYGRNLDHALAEVRHLAPGVWNREAAAGVTYIGSNLTRAELTGLFQASDAYVTSYRAEGFSLPSLEALGCGLPVIATRGGPTDDFCPDRLCLKIEANLRPMRNGLRFFDPSIESIVACMQSAVDDEALRARAAVEGSAWAAQNHSWSKVTQSLAGLLYG